MINYLTKESLEKLKKELDYLKNVKRKEIAERLKHAISFGDLTENAAYEEAKDAQGFLEGRIRELESLIKSCSVLENSSKDKVQVGSTVIISQTKKNAERESYTLVSPPEADPCSGKISADSPFGKALLGKKKGDKFKFELPDGKTEYKVIKIE